MNVNMKLNIVKELEFLIIIRNGQKVKRAEKAYDLISTKMLSISEFFTRDILLYPLYRERGEAVPQLY